MNIKFNYEEENPCEVHIVFEGEDIAGIKDTFNTMILQHLPDTTVTDTEDGFMVTPNDKDGERILTLIFKTYYCLTRLLIEHHDKFRDGTISELNPFPSYINEIQGKTYKEVAELLKTMTDEVNE